VSFKARVLVIRTGGAVVSTFDVGAKKDGTTRWSQVMSEEEEGDVNKELDNLGLDDE
jgi:hypothetical protein